ncbi:MAG: colicin E3/pyocin S6 family cytotoxin [Roseburia hominis]
MPYVAKPKPCYMDQFEFYKVIDGRKVYRGNGRLYSWDELHGEIEVFNKQGWHLGALDAKTGELIKQARKDRSIPVIQK